MSNDRMTVVPDFLGELDAGVFMNKIAAALNTTALGVLNNGNKGKVVLTFDFERMGNSVEEKRVKIKHKLNYSTPTPRGKASEEDTTETPMWVNKGGKLVPIVPTEKMVIEGFESEPDEFFSKSEVWEAYQKMSGCEQAAHRAKLCWAAMISAAPQQEVKL